MLTGNVIHEHNPDDSDNEELLDAYDLPDTTVQLHPQHPLYLHPNDHPCMILVNDLLTEYNFSKWQRSITIALTAKNKLGIVNGSNQKPIISSKYYLHWEKCNSMIISWLINACSKEIATSVVFFTTAKDIWEDLTVRFAQINGPKIFQTRKDIASLTQGTAPVNTYFIKLRGLWDELSSLTKCICNCTCGSVLMQEAYDNSEKLNQFLMGINEHFTATRGQILMMNPLPTTNQALQLLIQVESSKLVYHFQLEGE